MKVSFECSVTIHIYVHLVCVCLCVRVYLVECFLQVWCSHPLSHVSVCRVRQKELPLCCQSSADVLPAIDVLLTPVHHANVAYTQTHTQFYFKSPISKVQLNKGVCMYVCTCVSKGAVLFIENRNPETFSIIQEPLHEPEKRFPASRNIFTYTRTFP